MSSAQCVMARVKKINVVIYDDLAPWKLFSDKFSPYPNSSMRRSLVIFLLGTDHRHYHQYTDNGSLHRVRNNVLTFILKEHLLFSFLTASLLKKIFIVKLTFFISAMTSPCLNLDS